MRRKYVFILVVLFVLLLTCKELTDKTPEGVIHLLFKYSKKSEWQSVENLFSSAHMNSEDIQELQKLFATDELTNIETKLLKKDSLQAKVLITLITKDGKKMGIEPVELMFQQNGWQITCSDSLYPLSLKTKNYRSYSDPLVHYNLGNIYGKLGRYDEAIESYKRTTQLKVDFAEAYWGLGTIYAELERYNEAIKCFNQSLRIKPYVPEVQYNLGKAYSKLAHYDESVASYKQTISLKPDFIEAYLGLGFVYYKLGVYNKAIDTYTEAILIKPDNAIAYSNRGYMYIELQRYDDALRDFKQVFELDKDYKDAYVGMAIIYYEIGDKEKAIENYNKAIELDKRYLGKIDELADEEIFYTESQLEVIDEILKDMEK